MNLSPRVVVAVGLLGVGFLGVHAQIARQDVALHFHHVHLNVTDVAKTLEFYQRVLGAVPVKYGGTADSLFTERSFLLLDKVATPAAAAPTTSIWHIGWGGVDLPNEYEWWKARGVEFQTPLTKFGQNYYMYMFGPDKELIEIYSGEQNHRYNHVHLLAADVNVTTQWYADLLGIELRRREVPRPEDRARFWANAVRVDNVTINVFGAPDTEPVPSWWSGAPLKTFTPTRGTVVDHVAFSHRTIEPVFERLRKSGVKIVEPIAVRKDVNLKSFFVQGPDGVLVEIVEARPLPDAIWEQP